METTPMPPSNSSVRKTSNASNSPEFEFWMVRNPSLPEPNQHSADELFVDGVIRPLHLLHHSDDPPTTASLNSTTDLVPGLGPNLGVESLASPAPTTSMRWKDIFKKDSSGKEEKEKKGKEKDNEKKKERKVAGGGGGGNGTSAAELNIYLWPFSRSRSAGTGGSKPRLVNIGSRKVSSAPCSRSNSAGESKLRRSSSPSRGGVHLGRNSPVWQVRRNGSGRSTIDPLTRNAEKGVKKEGNDVSRSKSSAVVGGGTKAKVLNLRVPMCIGYRQPLSCRSDENGVFDIASTACGNTATGSQSVAGIGTGESGRGSNLFNFRSLFTKKVY